MPVEDRETWAWVARQTADALALSAELRRTPAKPVRVGLASAAGASLLLASALRHGQGRRPN